MNNPVDFSDLATLLGFQEDGLGGGFWLYNLTCSIPGHPEGSTVTERTLREYTGAPVKKVLCHLLRTPPQLSHAGTTPAQYTRNGQLKYTRT